MRVCVDVWVCGCVGVWPRGCPCGHVVVNMGVVRGREGVWECGCGVCWGVDTAFFEEKFLIFFLSFVLSFLFLFLFFLFLKF